LSTNAETDQVDIEALLAGDRGEFEKVVRQESSRLYRMIARLVSDPAEAESLLQETFLQAFQRLDTFRREAKFTTWLYAIGINLARAQRRKLQRTVSLSEEDVERMQPSFTRGMFQPPPVAWDPHKLAIQNERHDLVHKAIQKLPEDYRVVLTLRDIEEYGTDEVAEMLDISSGAVRVRLHRARQALKKLLDKHFN
jgi:RNA polymerase sigma-70 factor, ECF subfamily